MIDQLRAELEGIEAKIEQAKAELNQLIGAKTAFEYVIDLMESAGEGQPSPAGDEDDGETQTLNLRANGLQLAE